MEVDSVLVPNNDNNVSIIEECVRLSPLLGDSLLHFCTSCDSNIDKLCSGLPIQVYL